MSQQNYLYIKSSIMLKNASIKGLSQNLLVKLQYSDQRNVVQLFETLSIHNTNRFQYICCVS